MNVALIETNAMSDQPFRLVPGNTGPEEVF